MTKEENLDELVYQLTELGFPRTALYEYLDSCFGMERIPYDYRKRLGDDLMSYHLTIRQDKVSGSYKPEGYKATLLKTHPIQHSVIDGIDTLALEHRLKAIDWTRYLPKNNEVGDEMFRAVIDVVNLGLSETKGAADISRRLQLRYWMDTPVEQDLNVRSHIVNYQKRHYFPLHNGLSDITGTEAYNLLSGRAVMKFRQTEGQPNHYQGEWKELSDGILKTLPNYDLAAALKSLPMPEALQVSSGPNVIYDLLRGDLVKVVLEERHRITPVYIEANPRGQSITLYDLNGVRLSPEELQPKQSIKQPNHTPAAPRKRTGKNKGRSI